MTKKIPDTFLFSFFCIFLLAGCTQKTKLEWHRETGYRWAELSPDFWGNTGFKSLASSQTNIHFINKVNNEKIIENRHYLNGSGVAAGDVDGDGLTDLYFANLAGPNKLYKNLDGFRFKDVTDEAGVAHHGFNSTGVVFADVDGDEDLDLLITSLTQKNVLYKNKGRGQFELIEKSGLGVSNGSTSMALADIDQDQDLDLYIANFRTKSAKDIFDIKKLTLQNILEKRGNSYALIPPYKNYFTLFHDSGKPQARQHGAPDKLFINDGTGYFEKVLDDSSRFLDSDGSKKGFANDWGLTAKFQDINQDGLPDLYVCNDFWTPDRIWINQGKGIFKAMDNFAIRKLSFASMAVDFSDINRDGSLDFFTTEMLSPIHQRRMRQFVNSSPFVPEIGEIDNQPQYVQNMLAVNRGDNTFAETAFYSGVAATGWSWATNFMDVDLDGFEDIIITTGHAYDYQDLDTQEMLGRMVAQSDNPIKGFLLRFPPLKLANEALKNNRDLTFSKKGEDWGFKEKDVSHGLAIADLDNDGDLDLATNRLNQTAVIYENTTSKKRIAVRVKGKAPNTQAIGTKIELKGGKVVQKKEIVSGGSYVSGSDPQVTFAANGGEKNRYQLTVTWPGGGQSTIDRVRANRIYEIKESTVSGNTVLNQTDQQSQNTDKLFQDISTNITHAHHENEFNDFEYQPMLPVRMSRLGPGVSWIDFDQDGNEELFIGTGKGSNLAIFKNNKDGNFESIALDDISQNVPGDQTAIIGWTDETGSHIIIGSSNYEQGSVQVASALHYTVDQNGAVKKKEQLPAQFSSTGPIAMADYDQDSDLDLFIGGRFVPTRYPQDASSKLYKNENGSFFLDKTNSQKLRDIGLTTGAVFSDIDQDGDQDLLLSREWDHIMMFENDKGILNDISSEMGLDRFQGWWNGIATGDFNNDGLPDLIATNWGDNSFYSLNSNKDKPLKLFYGDFDQDRQVEIMDTYYDVNSSTYVPRRQLYDLEKSIPKITRTIQSHKKFAQLSLKELLNTTLTATPYKQINTLSNLLLLNKKDHFAPRPLPKEAQWSAAYAAITADMNNDGNEDLFISQNLFDFPPDFPRLDAGRGLWLKGDGSGNFETIPGQKSGVLVYGQQRGAAVSDINKDAKIDLAVAQNGTNTKLYLNQTVRSGVRIRLQGPPLNKNGIGSSIRLIYHDSTKGPRREIQAGSGYISQNSATQVMGIEKAVSAVEIIWPDGRKQKVSIDGKQKEYQFIYSVGQK